MNSMDVDALLAAESPTMMETDPPPSAAAAAATSSSSAAEDSVAQAPVSEGANDDEDNGFTAVKKRRSEMTPEERKADNQRKKDYKARKAAENRQKGIYPDRPKAEHFFRLVELIEKISLATSRVLIRELGRQTSGFMLAAGRRNEVLDADEIAIDHHRWVEVGDRGKTAGLDAKSRMGHIFFRFEANSAKVFWKRLLGAAVKELKISTVKLREEDPRPCFTVSLATDFWESLGPTLQQRKDNFLELVSYLDGGEFPKEGSDVVASFLKKADPNYTILLLKVSDAWAESAARSPVLRTVLGTLRLFRKTDKELRKEVVQDDVATELEKVVLEGSSSADATDNVSEGDAAAGQADRAAPTTSGTSGSGVAAAIQHPRPSTSGTSGSGVAAAIQHPRPSASSESTNESWKTAVTGLNASLGASPGPSAAAAAGLNAAPPLPAPPTSSSGPLKGFTIPRKSRSLSKPAGSGSGSRSSSTASNKRPATSPAPVTEKGKKKKAEKASPKEKQS